MKIRQTALTLLSSAAVFTAIGANLWSQISPNPPNPTDGADRPSRTRVRKEKLVRSLFVAGELAPVRAVRISVPRFRERGQVPIQAMAPEGSVVKAGDALLQIDNAQLIASLNSEEINVHPGQAVHVKIDALPDEKLTGKVVSVGSVLRMRRWDNPVKVIDAVIELEQKIGKLSPGMTATGQIEVERVANALLAPVKAVREKGGQVIVRVPAAGESGEERAIRVGRRNQQFVEVLEGLREGEKVIMP
jgi:multidrug efflux pump subunit AcrA (membrane-fusion protein)